MPSSSGFLLGRLRDRSRFLGLPISLARRLFRLATCLASCSTCCSSVLVEGVGWTLATATALQVTSWILSACSATSSRLSIVREASMACNCDGSRPIHRVRRSCSGIAVRARDWRWRKNCDGLLSPISSCSSSCRICCSCEAESR